MAISKEFHLPCILACGVCEQCLKNLEWLDSLPEPSAGLPESSGAPDDGLPHSMSRKDCLALVRKRPWRILVCLRELRKNTSLSEVAKGSQISESRLIEIERGTKHPSKEELARLAEYYEADLTHLTEMFDLSDAERISSLEERLGKMTDAINEVISYVEEWTYDDNPRAHNTCSSCGWDSAKENVRSFGYGAPVGHHEGCKLDAALHVLKRLGISKD